VLYSLIHMRRDTLISLRIDKGMTKTLTRISCSVLLPYYWFCCRCRSYVVSECFVQKYLFAFRTCAWWTIIQIYEEPLTGMWGRVNHWLNVDRFGLIQLIVLKPNVVYKNPNGATVIQVMTLLKLIVSQFYLAYSMTSLMLFCVECHSLWLCLVCSLLSLFFLFSAFVLDVIREPEIDVLWLYSRRASCWIV